MFKLPRSLAAWGADNFEATLKTELEHLDHADLPLQQALARSSYCSDEPFTVMVLRTTDRGDKLHITVGIAYSGMIAGCNCADDPSPVESLPEYCELDLQIDKLTASTSCTLI